MDNNIAFLCDGPAFKAMVRVTSEEKQPLQLTAQSAWEEVANDMQLKQSWRADDASEHLKEHRVHFGFYTEGESGPNFEGDV